MRRNFTIDDMSPLVNYIPITSWQDGNSVDIKKDKYFGGTFRLSTLKDAKAAFTFNGTGVWILGAKRANHGPYTSTIDGGEAITLDGFSPPPGIYQVPLVTRANLALGVHTVEIVNARAIDDRPYLDVDAFIWETEIPDDTNTSLILDDNHHAMQYLPSAAAWSNNTCPEVARYSGGTCHETSDPKGTLRLFFRGELITVYGGLGPDRGPYTVTLDSREPVHLTAISESYQTQQVIYFADNLGPGDHMLTISNNPSKAGEILDIDYISIWGNPTITDILNGGLSNSPTNPGSTHRR
ncbi:hypothetical protein FRC03_006193 [Tulasnella sp. 419]|nr:hypothetical protein FRC03_006193 [Tulasnella sp. 419]